MQRIELNPGSYVPVFSQPATDAPALEVVPAQVPSRAAQSSQPRRTRKTYWPAGFAASGVIIVVILVLGTRYWRHFEKHESALEEVWSPLLTSSKPILFCVGGTEMLISPHDPSLTGLQSVADDDSVSPGVGGQERLSSLFRRADSQQQVRVSGGARGHAFRIQNFRTTLASQLREGPVVSDWSPEQ